METLCKIRDLYRAIAEFETRFEKAHHLCLNEGMLLCCLSRKKRLSSADILLLGGHYAGSRGAYGVQGGGPFLGGREDASGTYRRA